MNPESEQWKERVDRPGLLNVLGVFLTVDGGGDGVSRRHVDGVRQAHRLSGWMSLVRHKIFVVDQAG